MPQRVRARTLWSLPHNYSIDERGDHMWVSQSGLLETVEAALELQRAVEARVKATGIDLIVFDNRQTDPVTPEVRESMFSWATQKTGPFHRVALLLQSDLSAVRVNMDALGRKAKLRAFASSIEAVDWLRASRGARRQDLPTG